ncbi:hypothetical protein D3C71_1420680 [compost metagenome]
MTFCTCGSAAKDGTAEVRGTCPWLPVNASPCTMTLRAALCTTRRVRVSTRNWMSVSSVPYWPALVSRKGLAGFTRP